MRRHTLIYGPSGCGKTTYGLIFAELFGCRGVFDDFDNTPTELARLAEHSRPTIILTRLDVVEKEVILQLPRPVQYLSFENAMAHLSRAIKAADLYATTMLSQETPITSAMSSEKGAEIIRAAIKRQQPWEVGDTDNSVVTKAVGALSEQVGGDHYKTLAIQPLEYSLANKLDAVQHSIIKYATRHPNKGGADDLRKVIHFAQLGLQLQYGEQDV